MTSSQILHGEQTAHRRVTDIIFLTKKLRNIKSLQRILSLLIENKLILHMGVPLALPDKSNIIKPQRIKAVCT